MTSAVADHLSSIIAEMTGGATGDIDLGLTWRELGLNSLDILEVVVRAEELLGVRVPEESTVRLFRPSDLLGYLALALDEA